MKFLKTLYSRWRNHMPVFFSRLCWTCSLISGTAIAINTSFNELGGAPQWWQDIHTYLIAFPAGIAFAAKFTQQYNGQPLNNDKIK